MIILVSVDNEKAASPTNGHNQQLPMNCPFEKWADYLPNNSK